MNQMCIRDSLVAHPAQHVADGVGVGGHAAHDVAGARVVEIREVKFVQFLVFVADETKYGVLSETDVYKRQNML